MASNFVTLLLSSQSSIFLTVHSFSFTLAATLFCSSLFLGRLNNTLFQHLHFNLPQLFLSNKCEWIRSILLLSVLTLRRSVSCCVSCSLNWLSLSLSRICLYTYPGALVFLSRRRQALSSERVNKCVVSLRLLITIKIYTICSSSSDSNILHAISSKRTASRLSMSLHTLLLFFIASHSS